MDNLINLAKNKVLNGEKIDKIEALKIVNSINLDNLLNAANEIREAFCGDEFNLCTIINVKSGKCSQDCKFCAQSAHYKTGCEVYPFKDISEILETAKYNEKQEAHRFSLVASGKDLNSHKKDIDKIREIYENLQDKTSLHLCASFGMADKKDLLKLKESGVRTYHHNLESSRRFYPKICTTHTYDDRINTIKAAFEAGLDVCSGGIFGLGESIEDRIDMAIELRELGVSSVPINILTPIKGTPFQNNPLLDNEEILRSIAIYRFILPNVFLRFAGGRKNLGKSVKKALKSGINAALTGDFLTTTGDSIESDKSMIKDCGFHI
ncbi:biotin synthetase [Campylobacter blaseri]|uniref:Biotin synthase n=1 Tax=Campylobacter blaseri TaxID=2042961 RepID=A0A2P8R0N3_9BACT|nr:biotin synthase BioB [Campylobacter blaseri]PSM52052.1 biotin synthase BioB [Campylobacter blaseri]PSM53837.1 biotin synthase BioB [Campylobacter blaseri]QKF85610.1 biotin synthetase [Campylobacter blaseri]